MARIVVEKDSDTAGILLSKRELWLLMHYFNYTERMVHLAVSGGMDRNLPIVRFQNDLASIGHSLRDHCPQWKDLSNG